MSLIPLAQLRQEQDDAEAAMIAADLDRDLRHRHTFIFVSGCVSHPITRPWPAREMLDELRAS